MLTPKEIEANVELVRQNIDDAAHIAGVNSSEIILCGASKMQDSETVMLAANLDIDIFGENRVQELRDKYDKGAYGTKPCHLIGHLQTNKVRDTVGRAAVIQSVDSLKLLEVINDEAYKKSMVQDVMIEINLADEQSKSGMKIDDFEPFMEKLLIYTNIQICGLMTIPPISVQNGQNRKFFSTLRQLFIDTKDKKYDNVNMRFLSMGMSGDYRDAILEGANLIRIGTAIFGKRL